MLLDPRLSSPTSTSSQSTALLDPATTPLSAIALSPLTDPLNTSTSFFSASSAADALAAIRLNGGSSISTATNLDPPSPTNFIGGIIGEINSSLPNAYYKFTVNTPTNLNLALLGLTANVDLQLFNSAGTVNASSTYSGNSNEAINLANVPVGTYYIRVYGNNASSYLLDISATATGIPSNLLPIETEVGQLTATRTYSGSVSNTNTSNIYHFQLTNPGHFDLTLSGLSANADVRLIRDYNGDRIVDSGEELWRSFRNGQLAESINLSNLAAGDYYVQVYQYSGNTDYHLSLSTGDWFSNNLQDAGVIGEARYGYYSTDRILDRNDMIKIFREVEKANTISQSALFDLRSLVNNGTSLGMPESVRVLSYKVAYSDPANDKSGIGNLAIGSSANQLEQLVGKWFLGSARPVALSNDRTTAYGYREVNGSLFQDGINYTDVDQGGVADCYFLAGLATTALRSANTIRDMFIDNGDGTFTVRFFKPDGSRDYVTVDRYLPTDSLGYAVFAGWGGGANTSTTNELWVALAEKAYAQISESGWIGQDNTNSYNGTVRLTTAITNNPAGINDGSPTQAIRQITGLNTTFSTLSSANSSASFSAIVTAFNAGQLVTLSTKDSGVASNVVPDHVYVVVRYDQKNDRLILFNPWGIEGGTEGSQVKPGFITVSRQSLSSSFSGWSQTV